MNQALDTKLAQNLSNAERAMERFKDAEGVTHQGVMFSDGDGTVPLISLGGLCRGHWLHKGNQHNTTVITREYVHNAGGITKGHTWFG